MQIAIYQLDEDLTIRIPKTLATQAGLMDGMQVEVQVVAGKLTISPVVKPYELTELLDGITSDNLHDEINTGETMGTEVW